MLYLIGFPVGLLVLSYSTAQCECVCFIQRWSLLACALLADGVVLKLLYVGFCTIIRVLWFVVCELCLICWNSEAARCVSIDGDSLLCVDSCAFCAVSYILSLAGSSDSDVSVACCHAQCAVRFTCQWVQAQALAIYLLHAAAFAA